ncbi:MAG: hypothetical protein HC837_17845 [Chloroflexaceae bacterium]|nr:hypothetical protein [Chloroflexaceae bacterium]
MTSHEILAASRRLTLAEQSRLLAALAQQIAAAVAAEQQANARTPAADQLDSWTQILQLAAQHGVATGIGDLAHQHDHYIYGTPPRGEGE